MCTIQGSPLCSVSPVLVQGRPVLGPSCMGLVGVRASHTHLMAPAPRALIALSPLPGPTGIPAVRRNCLATSGSSEPTACGR